MIAKLKFLISKIQLLIFKVRFNFLFFQKIPAIYWLISDKKVINIKVASYNSTLLFDPFKVYNYSVANFYCFVSVEMIQTVPGASPPNV